MLPVDLQTNLAYGKNAKYYVHLCKNLHPVGWGAFLQTPIRAFSLDHTEGLPTPVHIAPKLH